MSRIGWLERYIGFDRLAVWHRWTGFAAVALLTGHAVFITLGYAAGSGRPIVCADSATSCGTIPTSSCRSSGFALFLAVG